MVYFKEYMLSIAAVLVFSSVVSEILTDSSWSKYVSFVCGLLFVISIINPVLEVLKLDFSFAESFGDYSLTETDYVDDEVRSIFSSRLEKTIMDDLMQKYNKTPEIHCSFTKENKIHLTIYGAISDEAYEYIKTTYSPDKIMLEDEIKE